VPESKAIVGAITDPVAFKGRVAVDDIFPGQQITAADFSIAASAAIQTKLVKAQRGVAIPADAVHGLSGHIGPGDHVDIFVGFNTGTQPVIKLLMQNALVLSTPGALNAAGGGRSPSLVIRANYQRAIELAFAADNGVLWLMLRPAANVKATPPEAVTVESLLFGVQPITVQKKIRDFVAAG
jgi:Flp pilus assembly protein CpaB